MEDASHLNPGRAKCPGLAPMKAVSEKACQVIGVGLFPFKLRLKPHTF